MTSPFEADILITGGAGFLGRGILRYMEQNRIAGRVTVYSRDEMKHYKLRARFPAVRTVLGDVRDVDRLTAVMSGHDVVIHAAALKHIPEAERDVSEALATNVDGSRAVITAAARAGVKKCLAVSTDKVVEPVNAYGATKMLMERAWQEAARLYPNTTFTTVRYGNVVSSTGSVIPLFRDQLRTLGHMTITSMDMTRFWMPIDEAVALVERALYDRRSGYTFISACAGAGILTVADAARTLEGVDGYTKTQVKIIGTRPGEKLHEVLLGASEARYARRERGYADTHFVLPPTLSHTGDYASDLMAYSSQAPIREMTVPEMVDLIKDSEEV